MLAITSAASQRQPVIHEIDISNQSRLLAVLTALEAGLLVSCGNIAVAGFVVVAKRAWERGYTGNQDLLRAIAVATCGYAVYSALRRTGSLDPSDWRERLVLFPCLCTIGSLITTGAIEFVLAPSAATGLDARGAPMDRSAGVMTGAIIAGCALVGFACVLLLFRVRLARMEMGLSQLLDQLRKPRGEHATVLGVRRIATGGRVVMITAGIASLLALNWGLPFMQASGLNVLVELFFLWAWRFLQVNGETLLAADKRRPILFLRSFRDDPTGRGRSLIDFSLESRLARHFLHFGPFIAVGSPKDVVPRLGAARVRLSDGQWQERVLGWMREAATIVMYSGYTPWVTWELRQVLELGCESRLILLFPECRQPARAETAARVGQLRRACYGTPWEEETMVSAAFDDWRAMVFRVDGSMLVIRSKCRKRDSYHLAALLAHYILLGPPSWAPAAPVAASVT